MAQRRTAELLVVAVMLLATGCTPKTGPVGGVEPQTPTPSGSIGERSAVASGTHEVPAVPPQRVAELIGDLKNATSSYDRYGVLEKLIGVGGDAVHPMVAALNDDDPVIRAFLIWGLGEIGDRRAVPALVERLSDKDIFRYHSEKDPAVVPLPDSPNFVAASAAVALGNIGDAAALGPLGHELSIAKTYNEQVVVPNSDPEKVLAYDAYEKELEGALGRLGAR